LLGAINDASAPQIARIGTLAGDQLARTSARSTGSEDLFYNLQLRPREFSGRDGRPGLDLYLLDILVAARIVKI
jgi:hypothetical protein